MKFKVDKKRIILSIVTILTYIRVASEDVAVNDIISQIMEIIGSIDISKKNEFEMLRVAIEKEIRRFFDYLDCDKCKAIVQECFSKECIEKYLISENEIECLSNSLKVSVWNQIKDESEKFDIDYICNLEDYYQKAEKLINSIHHIISANETLRTFEHQIVESQILAITKCINKDIELVLRQISVPNSAYLWNMPKKKNVNREISRLHYTANNVLLYDRAHELELLFEFCGYRNNFEQFDAPAFQWWMITGEGGTGKSRLAYDFSSQMEMKGWTVCYPFSNKRHALDKCSENLINDTLFIIDYTEMDLSDIGEWLIGFGSNKFSNVIIRVLLIQRFAKGIESLNLYRNLSEKTFIYSHVYNNGQFLKLETISDEGLKQLVIDYGRNKITKDDSEQLFSILSEVDKLKRPLFAIAIADAFIDGKKISGKIELLDYLCEKEKYGIKGRIKRVFEKNGNLVEDLSSIANNIFIMSTMIGGLNLSEKLEQLLPDEYTYLQTLFYEQRRRFYKETELFINSISMTYCDPIEPDIIGEYYVLKNIIDRENLLCRAWEIPYYMSRFVTRLYQDFEEQLLNIKDYIDNPRLPDTIEEISDSTFSGCNSLLSISIPNSVKKIGVSAFSWCSQLKEVTMPESITELSDRAFEGCLKLESIKISTQIKKLPSFVFYKCYNLRKVEIPSGVCHIDEAAFMDCINLQAVIFSKNSLLYTIGRAAFSNCVRLEVIDLPSKITIIGDNAFSSCSKIKKVIMSDAVKIVGESAFQDCTKLKEVSFPKNSAHIEEAAFAQCKSLENVKFFNNSIQIDEGAFYRSANSKLISILKNYCQDAKIEFKTLYYRKGVFEYLAQCNKELYARTLKGFIVLDDVGENLNVTKEICERLGFVVEIWDDMFIISENNCNERTV